MALRPVIAMYPGECEECGDEIIAGEDEIVSDGMGGWIHLDCADQDEDWSIDGLA